jgi:hypothetical protein
VLVGVELAAAAALVVLIGRRGRPGDPRRSLLRRHDLDDLAGRRAALRLWRLRTTAAGASPPRAATTASTSSADERGEGVPELGRVLLGQVQLVLAPIKAEGHSLGGLGPVDVVYQPLSHNPCHGPLPI